DGDLTGGVMYECVEHDIPFVLGGSVRDDGPLPDVYTDVVGRPTPCAPLSPASPSPSCWRRHCTPSPPATSCRRAWRRSASTSTRPSSPNSPTAAATRRWASSPTPASSSASWPSTSARAESVNLGWGHRYPMCPPEHSAVLYVIH